VRNPWEGDETKVKETGNAGKVEIESRKD